MQSGGGPSGRPSVVTSSPSPSSSSSAVSAPHSVFDSLQQQQQQHARQQSFQQQILRKSEGNEAFLAYQAGGLHGIIGGGNIPHVSGAMQLPQQQRKLPDSSQQRNSPHIRDDGHNRSQGMDQQGMNPANQAYLQYAVQASQQNSAMQQQARMGLVGNSSEKDQDMRLGNMKMQAANQAQASSSSTKPSFEIARGERQKEQEQPQTSEANPPTQHGQLVPVNLIRPMQAPQAQQNMQNISSNQLAMAGQIQAMQTWAQERNIDLSSPENAGLVAQLIPLMQSRMVSQQRSHESNLGSEVSHNPMVKQHAMSQPGSSENSPRGNSSSNVPGQSDSTNARPAISSSPFGSNSNSGIQHFSIPSREIQGPQRQSVVTGNGMPPMHPPHTSINMSQGVDQLAQVKTPEILQAQHMKLLNRSSPQSSMPSNDVSLANHVQSPGGPGGQVSHMPQHRPGFTKQQLHVLKAQILAFRRLKKGDGTLPQELLRAIAPPPLELQQQQLPPPSGLSNQDRSSGKIAEDQPRKMESNEIDSQAVRPANEHDNTRKESVAGAERGSAPDIPMLIVPSITKESTSAVSYGKEKQQQTEFHVKPEQDAEHNAKKNPVRSDTTVDRGKSIALQTSASDASQVKKPQQANAAPPHPKDVGSTRKYHGPLFDFPFFTRKHDSFGSSMMPNNSNNNLTLAYDVKDLLVEEGTELLNKKRTENLKKIGDLLAVNLERKRIMPDLVLKLQIEEKKLKLLDHQARLREEVDQQQQEIMAMPDRPYRKFVKLCERQRMELARQVQASQKAMRDKQLKSIFQWRKKLLESHWAIRDARTARNRGVAKYHERMLREFSKSKDDDRHKRMEALKNNDVERYREMLMEQQTSIPGDAGERYAVLTSFLGQTEEYLHKLGGKITATKNQQEEVEAANLAAAAARSQGLSEEEVRAAATCARDEVMIRNRFSEMNAPKDGSSVNKYYNLAHAVNERVARQPSMLRAGILRDYQLVGLQWMLSLYNNKLNGILADEMGLGKTVQVMALIAYLMEFKGNYGPHLIIVPNAVLVNWKSEFHNWLPNVSCIYYVGVKDQRAKLFSQEVLALKFNVLVTTYEFIMFDRTKLSKVDWKYIIIDEAQRMKDRDSVLARDLDRYKCQRRLLLTGTPLQNDLKELWSLLNLLLPEVFDNRKAFHDWFSKPFQKEGPTHNAEDDWLETEKKVIIIHRLHQILEPFMLRRRVEDVEGSLPPKVSIILRCKMSALQGSVYDWIKSTGTLRIDPEEEMLRIQKKPSYQAKTYKMLANRCMELRKTCNHPLLNYPYYNDFSKDFLVKSCGKLWILDRILIKLHRTGHRVLLFSTMTKLLDILEEYLQWRRLVYRRIDGTTSLEDRESAIVDFNSPNSESFIFLLSIRAAGRGLNLQSADTVVIYDPDPNPKNEEQAVARAHRIGQTREVKVIYMEAVVNKVPSHQKEEEFRNGGMVDSDDDELAGKDKYIGSIESLIRNNIQQYKIDMADEVINAGRFDQRTTHEERRLTLETLLHDEERYQETMHDVPSLQEVNRMIARSDEEVELFDQMDEELDWAGELTRYDEVPKWLRASSKEVNTTVAALNKKPAKNSVYATNIIRESNEISPDLSQKTERKRGRPKKIIPNYSELDDESREYLESSSEERDEYSHHEEEEEEIGEFDDEEAVGKLLTNNDQNYEDAPVVDVGEYVYHQAPENTGINLMLDEAGSSGSSPESRKLPQIASPSTSSQKFGSLSALDSRPSSLSKRLSDELEEGEIAISGDSNMDRQQSGSWIHDRDEGGEDEQVLQPKIKRKRSMRFRSRVTVERSEEKSSNEKTSLLRGDLSQLPFQLDSKYEPKTLEEPIPLKHEKNELSLKIKRNLLSRKVVNTSKMHATPKASRSTCISPPPEEEHSRDNWDSKVVKTSGTSHSGIKMSDIIHKRCKNVISKFQRRLDKEGQQITPLLTDLWKKIEKHSYMSGSVNDLLDVRKIDQRVERWEYNGVKDLVCDVQSMLKGAMQYYGCSLEVRIEAKKVHELFFDILKNAFPDTDFREARGAVSFSGPGAASTSSGLSSARQLPPSQNKRKLVNDVEADRSPPLKPRGHMSRSGSSSRDQVQYDDSPPLPTHPGELVICKKKRNDREKSTVKPRIGPVSPSPSMRPTLRSNQGSGSCSTPRELRSNQQTTHQQVNGGGNVGWANPVKRMRTDAGKRRPSHL